MITCWRVMCSAAYASCSFRTGVRQSHVVQLAWLQFLVPATEGAKAKSNKQLRKHPKSLTGGVSSKVLKKVPKNSRKEPQQLFLGSFRLFYRHFPWDPIVRQEYRQSFVQPGFRAEKVPFPTIFCLLSCVWGAQKGRKKNCPQPWYARKSDSSLAPHWHPFRDQIQVLFRLFI